MRRPVDVRRLLKASAVLFALGSAFGSGISASAASPAIMMDVATGEVLFQEEATQPWFPASTTKLMTVYVALSAVRDHQIELNTPLVVSARAHKMPPSKMGFPVGTQVTLDNALKMLMVRSANDIAITVAEGIAGSVEAFAEDMNQTAAQLGMRESHFVNPNGLPDPTHVSSVRDMAILARALYTQFPQDAGLFNLGELSMGSERIPNHNNLLGRYPGVDGMKTGFTCAAGFNVVASAYRDGRRLVVVVFGAPSVKTRSEKVSALLDRGFAGIDHPIASIVALPGSGAARAPDMRDQVCRGRGRLIAEFTAEVAQLDAPLMTPATSAPLGLTALNPERAFLFNTQNAASIGAPMAPRIASMPTPVFEPVPVRIGADPGYTGAVAQARAPHTPIGTETPPATAEAYAATAPARAANAVLGVDPNALPLRGRARLAHGTRKSRVMKAIVEAPVTKVIAGKEGDDLGITDTVKKDAIEKPAQDDAVKARRGRAVKASKSEAKKIAIGDGDGGRPKKVVARPASASAKKKTVAKSASAEPAAKAKSNGE